MLKFLLLLLALTMPTVGIADAVQKKINKRVETNKEIFFKDPFLVESELAGAIGLSEVLEREEQLSDCSNKLGNPYYSSEQAGPLINEKTSFVELLAAYDKSGNLDAGSIRIAAADDKPDHEFIKYSILTLLECQPLKWPFERYKTKKGFFDFNKVTLRIKFFKLAEDDFYVNDEQEKKRLAHDLRFLRKFYKTIKNFYLHIGILEKKFDEYTKLERENARTLRDIRWAREKREVKFRSLSSDFIANLEKVDEQNKRLLMVKKNEFLNELTKLIRFVKPKEYAKVSGELLASLLGDIDSVKEELIQNKSILKSEYEKNKKILIETKKNRLEGLSDEFKKYFTYSIMQCWDALPNGYVKELARPNIIYLKNHPGGLNDMFAAAEQASSAMGGACK